MKHLLLTTIAAVVLVGTAFADPIHDAAKNGNLAGVQAELDKGVNVIEKEDNYGRTPLHHASTNGHKKIVELLIAKGADVNAKSKFENTPLNLAAFWGHKEIVELFIAKGADVNAKSKYTGTPLRAAAEKGHKEIAELLIAEGANVNANHGGHTPLDWAISRKHPETVDLLRKHGGKTGAELKALMPRLTYDRGLFGFTFNTIEGKTYRVESGMDLIKWNSLGDIIGTGGEVKFIDARRIYFPYHFYRVKVIE
jgi:hypothetical protein